MVANRHFDLVTNSFGQYFEDHDLVQVSDYGRVRVSDWTDRRRDEGLGCGTGQIESRVLNPPSS
jgi:hypothetical protein